MPHTIQDCDERNRMEAGASRDKKRVFIVEDHPITSHGIAELLRAVPRFEVCGCSDSYESAIARIRKQNPDVVILELTLEDNDGLAFLRRLVEENHQVRPVVLTSCEEAVIAQEALRNGASGFVTKSEPCHHILRAVEHVLEGRVYLSDERRQELSEELSWNPVGSRALRFASLTPRECQVLALIGQGLGISEVAERLGISASTVERHRAHIREKTGTRTAAEVRRYAIQWMRMKCMTSQGDRPTEWRAAEEERSHDDNHQTVT